MASTYEPIATTTASGSSTSITFTVISSAYTDLILIGNYFLSSGSSPWFQLNGDTTAKYSSTIMSGNGTTASSHRTSAQTQMYQQWDAQATSTNANVMIANFQNYSNTTTYKTVLSRNGVASSGTDATVGLWRSTDAINSIKFDSGGPNIASGSTFTLYGIKAA